MIPLLVVWSSVRRDMTRMGENLADRTSNQLVHKASLGLERIVADHARIMHRERQLLESNARLLAAQVEGILSGHEHVPQSDTYELSRSRLGRLNQDYYRLDLSGMQTPLAVNFNRVHLSGRVKDERLARMAILLGQEKSRYPDLLLWIEITLENGAEARYPSPLQGGMMMGMRHMMRDPIFPEVVSWTAPEVDSYTRRVVFRVTAPVRDIHGRVEGRLTLVVPVDTLLHEGSKLPYSSNTEALLVRPGGNGHGLDIIAREGVGPYGMGHMWVPETAGALEPTDPEMFKRMIDDMRAGRSGVTVLPDNNNNELWAYAPISGEGTSLLLRVPERNIVKDAREARSYVAAQVHEHNSFMGFIVLVVAVLVMVMSFVLSKVVTSNISQLAATVRAVARGNFTVRAEVHSRDEVGLLGMTINRMVPELREKVRMQNSLEVAQEVQQSLLPSCNPTLPGMDIAAASTYCDETGGDYYGFISRSGERGKSLVVAVGDVTGHGVQAALTMASARAYLRAELARGVELDKVAGSVNALMSEDLDGSGRFMTLFLLELFEDGSLQWVRAGHDQAILYFPDEDRFEELGGEGLPLGVTPDTIYTLEQRDALAPGTTVVIGTDGIWESTSPAGDMFGKNRLYSFIRDHAGDSASGFLENLAADLTEFRAGERQLDDMTIAVLKRL